MASAFPEALDAIADDKGNETVALDDHPPHHNLLADAVNALQAAYLGQRFDAANYAGGLPDALAAAQLAGGGRVYFDGVQDIGTTGLLFDSSTITLEGASEKSAVIKYSGGGAALWINPGNGNTNEQARFSNFSIDCRVAGVATGAVGIRIGHGTGALHQGVAALFDQVRVAGALTYGWWLQGAQECVFINCVAEACGIAGSFGGDGLYIDCGYTGAGPTFNALNANTACIFVNFLSQFNNGRGGTLRQCADYLFLRSIFQSNGLENLAIIKPDPTIYLNSACFQLHLQDCYFEHGNINRAAGPWYQVLIDNENGQAGSVGFDVIIEGSEFGVANTGSNIANSQVGLGFGDVQLRRNRYVAVAGSTAPAHIVAFRDTSAAVLDVDGRHDLAPISALIGDTTLVVDDLTGKSWANGDTLAISGETGRTINGSPADNADAVYSVILSAALAADHALGATVTNSTRSNGAALHYLAATGTGTLYVESIAGLGWVAGDTLSVGGEAATIGASNPTVAIAKTYTVTLSGGALEAAHAAGTTITNSTRGNSVPLRPRTGANRVSEVSLAGPNIAFTGHSTRSGARTWWTNRLGLPYKAAGIALGGYFALGAGVGIKDILTGVATVDMGTVNAGAIKLLSIPVQGAGSGNSVRVGIPTPTAGIVVGQAYAVTDSVAIPYFNPTASGIAVGSVTARATVEHF